MKIRNILLTSAAVLFCTASMSGQSSHTWVAGTGNDNFACTEEKPCATFQGALAKTAAGGMISVASPGDFGPVNIAKSVTIDGSNIGSIATNAARAISIQFYTGGNVTIRNLIINGLGRSGQNGIVFTGTGYLTVENCRIESFSDTGIDAFSQGQENVVVRNTTISDVGSGVVNAGYGTGRVVLQNVTIQGARGAAVYSQDSSFTEITNSVITQSGVGVQDLLGSTISVESSMLAFNTTAMCAFLTATIRLENNDIFDNGAVVADCNGTVETNGNNRTSGNESPVLPASVSKTGLF